ncbi:hypothetical protein F7734_09075 [Scytonema sp. UIC 10036]|jgi:hypothetical protein|uniref:hypothetical protein n=1 Tax=Scytonema sp. UIC 10036 TaxID=2304196 RepID=UPI0012DA6289|nr:hypothetical protein [Scytonema sp. UIC 10036]MUG92600.1 hypothetical protein [Scytonema sp. UIC 10036]
MQEQVKNQIEEAEELESSPCTGREISDEEALRTFDYYLSGKYLIKNLEVVQKRKQKTLEELAQLEAAEKRIIERIREQKIHLNSEQNQE